MRRYLLFVFIAFCPLLAVAGAGGTSPGKPELRLMHFSAGSNEARVNINTADVHELTDRLKGVGEKKAQAIVDYREANGDFRSLGQLEKVKGIGPAIVKKNRQLIYIEK